MNRTQRYGKKCLNISNSSVCEDIDLFKEGMRLAHGYALSDLQAVDVMIQLALHRLPWDGEYDHDDEKLKYLLDVGSRVRGPHNEGMRLYEKPIHIFKEFVWRLEADSQEPT